MLKDDSGNVYRYVSRDVWPGDGSSFCMDEDGRPIFGPEGPMQVTEDAPNPGPHRSAAAKLGISVAEYEDRRSDGERWCSKCGSWVPLRLYGRHPLARLCLSCERERYKERRKRRRSGPRPIRVPRGPHERPIVTKKANAEIAAVADTVETKAKQSPKPKKQDRKPPPSPRSSVTVILPDDTSIEGEANAVAIVLRALRG